LEMKASVSLAFESKGVKAIFERRAPEFNGK